MNNSKIKDITKINDKNESISYLVTVSDNNDRNIKTFLVTYFDDFHYEIKRIINLIAYVENNNIVLDKDINELDLSRIYHLSSLLNSNNKQSKDERVYEDKFQKADIDKQYYDENIKIYDSKGKTY